jgi:glycosyltransferase involved in cell wall biosynthesis
MSKVCVLCHDLANNALGRAHVIGRLLAAEHQVEIVGPLHGQRIWAPLRRDMTVPIKPIDRRGVKQFIFSLDCDLLYAIKPKPTSLGIALAAKMSRGLPVVADVDDWEAAFYLENPRWFARNLIEVWKPNNAYLTLAAGRVIRLADAVTVSSTFLQQKFGGTVLPHSRDIAMFPEGQQRDERLAEEIGVDGKTVVMFVGSPRAHKGIADVINALDRLQNPRLAFVVVGSVEDLPARAYLRSIGPQPFDRLPAVLALADMVVLAQRKSRIGDAQVPAKVFDAMAMAKPVIATRVSDLPAILAGCGLIVECGDIAALAAAIGRLADDLQLRQRLGSAGRRRFEREFSDEAVRPTIETVVSSALRNIRVA